MIAYPVANEPAFSNNTAGWVSTNTLLPLLTSLTVTVLALCACKQLIVYNQSTRTILSVRSWIHGQTRTEFKSSHNVCVHVCAYSACMRAYLCSVCILDSMSGGSRPSTGCVAWRCTWPHLIMDHELPGHLATEEQESADKSPTTPRPTNRTVLPLPQYLHAQVIVSCAAIVQNQAPSSCG